MRFRTILVDPPWPQSRGGIRIRVKESTGKKVLPYPTMSVEDIAKLPISALADTGCHLWLWTTNQFLRAGFDIMEGWGFTYLAPVHWIKPTGTGNWFIHRSQTLLMGYRDRCEFPSWRYQPNVITTGDPVRHSQKPTEIRGYIERISIAPRLEVFAREAHTGWTGIGNEVTGLDVRDDLDKLAVHAL